jgi:hypothetical protein
VLEDAATAGAALLAADGIVPVSVAIVALFVGITLGDLGLYGLGWLAARNARARRMLQHRAAQDMSNRKLLRLQREKSRRWLPAYRECRRSTWIKHPSHFMNSGRPGFSTFRLP